MFQKKSAQYVRDLVAFPKEASREHCNTGPTHGTCAGFYIQRLLVRANSHCVMSGLDSVTRRLQASSSLCPPSTAAITLAPITSSSPSFSGPQLTQANVLSSDGNSVHHTRPVWTTVPDPTTLSRSWLYKRYAHNAC